MVNNFSEINKNDKKNIKYVEKNAIIGKTLYYFRSMVHFINNLNELTPYFESQGEDKPREGIETIKRENVVAIIEHPEYEKYIILDWGKFGWKSFVMGGIENEEDSEEAGVREMIEETGFTDILYTKTIPGKIYTNFYAKHKGVNRFSEEKYIFIKLASLKNIGTTDGEDLNHSYLWADKGDIGKIINLENNKFMWENFINGMDLDKSFLASLKTFKGYNSPSAN